MNDPCLLILTEHLNRVDSPTVWVLDENLNARDIALVRPNPALRAVTNRYDLAEALQRSGIEHELSDFRFRFEDGTVGQIIYRVSKERSVVHHCINSAARVLQREGSLLLIGQKNDGIKNHGRRAEEVLGGKAAVKKHGLCYTAHLYSEATGDLLPCDDYPQLREIDLPGMKVFSKPGIFGWNKIDRGSELLVQILTEHLPDFETRSRVLDLGCGWGYLLLATGEIPFAERVATDNNVTALLAAEENFARAGLSVQAFADDCAAGIQGGFELILCNPPFHRGFSVSEELSQKFIRQAARLLTKNGKALFVVNQFVPLERLAEAHFSQVQLLAHQEGFKVFALSHSQ